MSHFTLAASSKAFDQMFALVRDNFKVSTGDSGSWGPFTYCYDVALHLEQGTVQLNDDDTVEITDLHVVWDQLAFKVCFALPGVCVGGQCIIPDPFDNCWVSLPKICIGGPICLPLDLSGLVSGIQDVKAGLRPVYVVDPLRPPGITDLSAEFLGKSNMWKVFLRPTLVDVLPIDPGATIANVFEKALEKAIQDAFSWIPGWAWSIIWGLLGPLLDLLKSVLGIVDDVAEWAIALLNRVFNLLAVVETAVAQYLASQYPLFSLEDPYPIMDGAPSHDPIPVKLPFRNLAAHVNRHEMVVTADIGA